ncbi:hypothetical protein [Providencia alcalifaciens]|uniref:hypothetical protein n=1 Tax=Providencia alcalifaciens TaxID=126385 RepID=UPI0012B5F020|nr:hypothetical protein [Providencia alcalifaciens]MTC16832.1 hypothetical protein [Providencia alcalifaciens]
MKLITQELSIEDFFKHGGTLEFEVESIEIDSNPNFCESGNIKPLLNTGFEITPPDTTINDIESAFLIDRYGDNWSRFVSKVYRKEGRIIYTQITNETYRARCELSVKD